MNKEGRLLQSKLNLIGFDCYKREILLNLSELDKWRQSRNDLMHKLTFEAVSICDVELKNLVNTGEYLFRTLDLVVETLRGNPETIILSEERLNLLKERALK